MRKTRSSALRLKNLKNELENVYTQELCKCVNHKIDIISQAAENQQSRLAWETVNEITCRKNTPSGKIQGDNPNERSQKWKNHFQNLLGEPPTIREVEITAVVNSLPQSLFGEPEGSSVPALISGFCSTKRLGVFLLLLDGILVRRRLPPSILSGCSQSNLLVPIYTPGWREALWESSVLPKNTTLVHRLGIELSTFRLSGPKTDALTTEPPRLALCGYYQ